jgi:hypothetical protein
MHEPRRLISASGKRLSLIREFWYEVLLQRHVSGVHVLRIISFQGSKDADITPPTYE